MQNQFSKLLATALWGALLVASCATAPDEALPLPASGAGSRTFLLHSAGYDGAAATRSGADEASTAGYDRLDYYVMTRDGNPAQGIRSQWRPAEATIVVEGLRSGDYQLLVLAVRGDAAADGATIHRLARASDTWLTLPEQPEAPLRAEYLYARIPFSVGDDLEPRMPAQITLRRLMGRVDFDFDYNNPCVRTAELERSLELTGARFYTSFAADSTFAGATTAPVPVQDLAHGTELCFMPTVDDTPLAGTLSLRSRSYDGDELVQHYDFATPGVRPNRLDGVHTQVVHPDDDLGTLYLTERGFAEAEPAYILQDDEPKAVYADRAQRSFRTTEPLQLSRTETGDLHLRFYSPRPLRRVRIRAVVPGAGDEPLDMICIDSLPAFADVVCRVPLLDRAGFFRTASGRIVALDRLTPEEWGAAQLSIVADDPYWEKLQRIGVRIEVYFGLYGGDPERPDGGPSGNWIGIRPVHCREAVATWLNFAYMLGLEEVAQMLRDNPDKLWGNQGQEQKVPAETIIAQMRSARTLCVGLVSHTSGLAGLGGGSVWGVYEYAFLYHYDQPYQASFMFHEFGHVLGYNHSSSLTYGPWAEDLMPNYYVNHIAEFPIDRPDYLDSRENPTRYTR